MSLIADLLQQNKKLHFPLIDPDKQTPEEAGQIAKICNDYGTNAIMIGGSTIKDRKQVYDTIDAIKLQVKLPIILFPNSAESISENADYILFMRLLNSLEYKYNDIEKAVEYALIAEMSGASCVYFDAGCSGAERPISNEMTRAIRDNIDIPLIIGGGIRNGDTAKEKINAGADVIVNS